MGIRTAVSSLQKIINHCPSVSVMHFAMSEFDNIKDVLLQKKDVIKNEAIEYREKHIDAQGLLTDRVETVGSSNY
jgi:hypothetical protein